MRLRDLLNNEHVRAAAEGMAAVVLTTTAARLVRKQELEHGEDSYQAANARDAATHFVERGSAFVRRWTAPTLPGE